MKYMQKLLCVSSLCRLRNGQTILCTHSFPEKPFKHLQMAYLVSVRDVWAHIPYSNSVSKYIYNTLNILRNDHEMIDDKDILVEIIGSRNMDRCLLSSRYPHYKAKEKKSPAVFITFPWNLFQNILPLFSGLSIDIQFIFSCYKMRPFLITAIQSSYIANKETFDLENWPQHMAISIFLK